MLQLNKSHQFCRPSEMKILVKFIQCGIPILYNRINGNLFNTEIYRKG